MTMIMMKMMLSQVDESWRDDMMVSVSGGLLLEFFFFLHTPAPLKEPSEPSPEKKPIELARGGQTSRETAAFARHRSSQARHCTTPSGDSRSLQACRTWR